jgi:hypothetical protein
VCVGGAVRGARCVVCAVRGVRGAWCVVHGALIHNIVCDIVKCLDGARRHASSCQVGIVFAVIT